jgi:hypothetical protein
MLFDLKGKRRRVVQITYVGLALLMGGGLVLTGIGSSASGGLLDAIIGNGSSSSDSDVEKTYNKKIDAANKKLEANPKDAVALADLVRANFALAGLSQDQQTGGYDSKGKDALQEADSAWTRYIELDPAKIDSGLVATAFQLYADGALQNPQKQLKPAQLLAEEQNTPEAYVNLVQVATKAGNTRVADLAGRKAISLGETKDDKASIKEQVNLAKQSAGSGGGAGTAQPPAGG